MDSIAPERSGAAYTPAAGYHWLTRFYDAGVAVLTREGQWREALVRQLRPAPVDVVADIGCGTGSTLVRLGKAAPKCRLLGVDPDMAILERARAKLGQRGLTAELLQGFAHDADRLLKGHGVTKIVSCLVFHQVPLEEKSAGLAAAFRSLDPGGEIHIADYSLQRSALMRLLFRITVQTLDGVQTTEPHARGVLPDLIRSAGFVGVVETAEFRTPSGSISLFRGVRP